MMCRGTYSRPYKIASKYEVQPAALNTFDGLMEIYLEDEVKQMNT
jgi:hypothetical protein